MADGRGAFVLPPAERRERRTSRPHDPRPEAIGNIAELSGAALGAQVIKGFGNVGGAATPSHRGLLRGERGPHC
eukprot:2221921-Lingulodinium_polyedra.AAC.1